MLQRTALLSLSLCGASWVAPAESASRGGPELKAFNHDYADQESHTEAGTEPVGPIGRPNLE
jgi:hypothetical protein